MLKTTLPLICIIITRCTSGTSHPPPSHQPSSLRLHSPWSPSSPTWCFAMSTMILAWHYSRYSIAEVKFLTWGHFLQGRSVPFTSWGHGRTGSMSLLFAAWVPGVTWNIQCQIASIMCWFITGHMSRRPAKQLYLVLEVRNDIIKHNVTIWADWRRDC